MSHLPLEFTALLPLWFVILGTLGVLLVEIFLGKKDERPYPW